MKKISLALFIVCSLSASAQESKDFHSMARTTKVETDQQLKPQIDSLTAVKINVDHAGNKDMNEMVKLTIEGLKAIRHDNYIRLRFRRAHWLTIEIRQEKNYLYKY